MALNYFRKEFIDCRIENSRSTSKNLRRIIGKELLFTPLLKNMRERGEYLINNRFVRNRMIENKN
ncbi:MAG: hypothetical protein DRH70_08170 [Candidatus Coatesbacteria bacterium]|nr:MAG: hypothetical protein DRH70_08170 [Candidatus Coatesbacteria bacterium]